MTDMTTPVKNRFLRQKAVTDLTGIPRPTLYYMMGLGKFPKNLSLCSGGKSVAWLESDVLAWMAERIAASKAV